MQEKLEMRYPVLRKGNPHGGLHGISQAIHSWLWLHGRFLGCDNREMEICMVGPCFLHSNPASHLYYSPLVYKNKQTKNPK